MEEVNKCKAPNCEGTKYEYSLYCYECNYRVINLLKSINLYRHKINEIANKLTDAYGIIFEHEVILKLEEDPEQYKIELKDIEFSEYETESESEEELEG